MTSNNAEHLILAAIDQHLNKERADTLFQKTIKTPIIKYISLYLMGGEEIRTIPKPTQKISKTS